MRVAVSSPSSASTQARATGGAGSFSHLPGADASSNAGHPRQDNVRLALNWAFSPRGDTDVGVALTIAAAPLWTHLSLMEECRGRVEQALDSLRAAASRDLRREMQLLAALGAALMYTKGAVPETQSAFAGAFQIADRLEDTDYRLRALWGLWVDRMNSGDVQPAIALAENFSRAAANSSDPLASPVGDRMIGFARHFMGEQASARRHIERMLVGPRPSLHDRHIVRFQFDPWVTARSRLAMILWLQGYPDQAVSTVRRGVEEALAANHAVTLCNVFAQGACPVTLLIGDLPAAEHFVAMLLEYSERHGLAFWHADGRCFQGVLLIRRGDTVGGLELLRATLDELSRTPFPTRYDPFLGELAEALARAGRVAQGLATIDQALDRAEQIGGLWYVAELLRIKGEILLKADALDAAGAAEELFQQAIDWGRRQDALSWELRGATSLARLYHRQDRANQARKTLAPIYRRFSEGFETSDLVSARALLDRSGSTGMW
jgi:predicted ATPase